MVAPYLERGRADGMPISLRKLAGTTAQTSFEYAGETVNLTYYSDRYTPALVGDLMALAAMGGIDPNELALMEAGASRFQEIVGWTPKALSAIIDALVTLVAAWDVEGDDGEPYPITHESLSVLPFTFLTEVLTAVQAATSAMPPGKAPATSPES
jgi:hypothetical protein